MTPVIELKGKNNTEYYSEIVDLANQFEVNPVYISFHIENLQTMRRLTQCKMYYLVQKSAKMIFKTQKVSKTAALISTVIKIKTLKAI